MTKKDWIKLINAIRIRKKEYKGEDGEIKYTLAYTKSNHRASAVKLAANAFNINLQPLPSYSPDFMLVEHLWKWLRENVINHTCYHNKTELINQVACFELAVNSSPLIVNHRLWVKNHLNPAEEKLQVST